MPSFLLLVHLGDASLETFFLVLIINFWYSWEIFYSFNCKQLRRQLALPNSHIYPYPKQKKFMNLYVSLMAFHKPLGHPSPGLLRSSSETFPSLSRSYWQIYFCPRSTPHHPLCFSSLLSPTGQQTRFYDTQRIIQYLVPQEKMK